ncbi:MAG: hypothetical protein ABI398_06820 [Devosia sp.]
MTETLEIGDRSVAPLRPRIPPEPLSPPYLVPPKQRFKGIVSSATASLDDRRLFVLLPFAMIAGLIVSLELPVEPHPLALGAGAAAIVVTLAVSLGSLAMLRLATLAAAFWA